MWLCIVNWGETPLFYHVYSSTIHFDLENMWIEKTNWLLGLISLATQKVHFQFHVDGSQKSWCAQNIDMIFNANHWIMQRVVNYFLPFKTLFASRDLNAKYTWLLKGVVNCVEHNIISRVYVCIFVRQNVHILHSNSDMFFI